MKKVLITGASGGIGLEITRQLALRNYQLTLVVRNKEKLNKVLPEVGNNGLAVLEADLTDKDDLDRLADHLRSTKYDVLINNAGAGAYGRFIDIQVQDHLHIMQLNMDALVILSHVFLQTAKSGDALVNIGSLIAFSSLPGASVYSGTKGFVTAFSESLWYEFKKKGIFVMGFNPGATKSDFHLQAGKEGAFPEFVMSSSEQVAKELVKALEARKKPRVVQGWKNRMMLFAFKFFKRRFAINMMGKISPSMSV